MIIEAIWLTKLLLAHIVTDFIIQPSSWVEERTQKHFASLKLYLHVLVTAAFAWLMIGWKYWLVALIVLVSHLLIDGWKSYQKKTPASFAIDQLLHFLIIICCWYFSFVNWQLTKSWWSAINQNTYLWTHITAFTFITFPSGIIIGQFTKQWRDQIANSDSLGNAGKWIGIVERVIVLILVLQNQFEAIGLFVPRNGVEPLLALRRTGF
jgi:hypothetical protein